MKKTILYLILNLVLYSTSFSQTSWTNLIYHFQTGTVPPPYYYSYNINLSRTGEGTLVYNCISANDTSWTYTIIVPEDYLSQLDSAIIESNVLNDSIGSLKKHPIGGSIQYVQIFLKQDSNLDQVPKSIITPDFPLPEFKEKLEKLYDVIRTSVPQFVWDDIKSKKDLLKNKK